MSGEGGSIRESFRAIAPPTSFKAPTCPPCTKISHGLPRNKALQENQTAAVSCYWEGETHRPKGSLHLPGAATPDGCDAL